MLDKIKRSIYPKIAATLIASYVITITLSPSLFLNNTPRVNPNFIASVGQQISNTISRLLTGKVTELASSSLKTGAIILPWYYCPPDGRTCIPDRWYAKPPGADTAYPDGSYYSPANSTWWKVEASDMACAGLDIAFVYVWSSDKQYFDNIGNMVDTVSGLHSPFQIAEFWDASFESNDGGPVDLNDSATAQYRYEKFIKPFFTTVPQTLWSMQNNRPILAVYRFGTDSYTNSNNADTFFSNIKNLFKNDFGVEPFLILGTEWYDKTPAKNVADGETDVFNSGITRNPQARSHTVNGITISNISPGGNDYRPGGSHLDRKDGQVFRDEFAQIPSDTQILFIESWNELGEGSGMERADNYPRISGGTLPSTVYMDTLRELLSKNDRGACKSIDEIVTGRIPTGTPQPTAPPGQPTYTPIPTSTQPTSTTAPGQPTSTPIPGQPTSTPRPSQGSGVTIRVHKDSLSGPLWDQSQSVGVYIEGPAENGRTRFGELLQVYGSAKNSCISRGGFPYDCSTAGTAVWKGSDGRSGTSPGSYSSTIFTAPTGWHIILSKSTGTLSGQSLTLDLVVSQQNLPTIAPGNEPTPTPGGGGNFSCPSTSNQIYQSKAVGRYNHNKLQPPYEENPELNLRLRGWGEVNESTDLQSRHGNNYGLDPIMPPQYSSLYNGPVPQIAKTYVVYAWDFVNKKSLAPEVSTPNFKVHMIGLSATNGQALYGLKAGKTIDGTNVFLVLYATKNEIVFTHSDEDNIEDGYLYYFEDICVDPNLLTEYKNDSSEERRGHLPVIKTGQIFGYAANTDPKTSVRDTGSFVDPRAKEDWWFYPQ